MGELWRLDSILDLFRSAGEIALKYYGDPHPEVKEDDTPVTRADREVEAFFASRLDRPAEGKFLIGEESVGTKDEAYLDAALKGDCFVLDPIDGTAPYAAHVPLWGISLGYMKAGKLMDGGIYLPVQDEAFVTCRETIFRVRNLRSGEPEVEPFVPERPCYTRALPISVSQAAARNYRLRFPNQIFVWSSCVGPYHALLCGRFYGMIQHCKLWDLAGGMPLLRLAGFEMRFADGRRLNLDIAGGGDFILNGPGRWRQKGFVMIAPDREGTEFIWNNIAEINEKE